MKITMRITGGPHDGLEYYFPAEGQSEHEADNILVGRDDVDCLAHWRLPRDETTVSRAHFVLEVRPPNCYVQDNGSLNGVYLRRGNEPERRVEKEALRHGDRLRLGKLVVELLVPELMPVGTVVYQAEEREQPPKKRKKPKSPQALPPKAAPKKETAKSQEKPVQVEPPPAPAEPVQVEPPPAPEKPPSPVEEEWMCICCGERLEQLPPLDKVLDNTDFMCLRCRNEILQEREQQAKATTLRHFCSTCQQDLSNSANLDGKAIAFKDIALYLCPQCLEREIAKARRFENAPSQRDIEGYRLIRLLGEGGMGKVFKAWHVRTHRLAAVKLTREVIQREPRSMQRFLREIQIMEDLVHPNLVRLYGTGQVDGKPLFISEFVPDGDLAQFISEEGQPMLKPPEVVHIIADSLIGLGYMHDQGYVHRDLKLENILLDKRTGQMVPKIADFGFARGFEKHGGTITRTGEFAGTYHYMPPEQITNFKRVKPPTDIYAMGVAVYYLLSGQTPLPDLPAPWQIAQMSRRRNPFSLPKPVPQMILRDRRVPLAERRRDLPRNLCRVVDKALALNPDERYQTAEEFRQALLSTV